MPYDVTTQLQNDLESRAYPFHKGFGEANGANVAKRRAIGLALLALGAVAMLVAWGIASSPRGDELRRLAMGVGLGGLTLVLYSVPRLVSPAGQAKKNQRRYYTLGKVRPLTDEQRRALHLTAHTDFYGGAWNETLEYFPATRRFADAGIAPPSFWNFPALKDPEEALRDLDRDWGIVSTDGYRKMVERLFAGMHSRVYRAAFDLEADQTTELKERLAGLVGRDEAYVEAQLAPRGDRPPALVWAFDLWRVLPMSREAYMANLVSEDEAWANILKAARWVYALFDTPQAYYDNLRLGHAFWSLDLAAVQERRRIVETFLGEQTDRWPTMDLPWTTGAVDFPEDVRDGLRRAAERDLRDDGPGGPIGFHAA